jgi:hypothetical protein
MDRYITELLAHATDQWVTMLDDDCTLEGPWLEELSKLPLNCFAYPEFYYLGQSHYTQTIRPDTFYLPGWFIPTPIMRTHFPGTHGPVDVQTFAIARKLALPRHCLKGVTYNHQRDEARTNTRNTTP